MLHCFGHVTCSGSAEDHYHTISAALNIYFNRKLKGPSDRPATWMQTVEKDLTPQHFGLHTAWCSDLIEEKKGDEVCL